MGRWHDTFDWARAVELNRDGLLRVLALLFATAGLKPDGVITALPRHTRSAVLSVLRPAESALRRLIIVAARGLTLPEHSDVKTGFDFTKLKQSKSERVPAFRLFDPRKRFDLDGRRRRKFSKSVLRIHFFHAPDPLVPLFRRPEFIIPQQEPEPEAKTEIDPARLISRMKALKNALDDLPKQARRLVRAQMRRKLIPSGPRCVGPMRPGLPLGYKKKPRTQVEEILTECHTLALYSLEPPT